jgi:hypothetical protein
VKVHFAVALLLMASAAAKLTEMLGDSSDLLKSGKYAEAMKLDDTVIREMGEQGQPIDAPFRFTMNYKVIH